MCPVHSEGPLRGWIGGGWWAQVFPPAQRGKVVWSIWLKLSSGVPLRSPLSDVLPFSIYPALSLSLSLSLFHHPPYRPFFQSFSFIHLSVVTAPYQPVFMKRVCRLIIFNHIEYWRRFEFRTPASLNYLPAFLVCRLTREQRGAREKLLVKTRPSTASLAYPPRRGRGEEKHRVWIVRG